ncbi:TetR/AcrR family transcriptional regulator [Thalassovita aquimarina]|uniref:TetR/AcrR family transcriptional regulator n=1 Tax=Thalassovita aquimarina TaxID=2785917 RepID=A0ABS5HTV7_9RHOB|nr:TetR/AcrR family transcriptional regulator [Thalassovita aquimarina]MBR9652414.1 TetR/AcrR family transcriptional regulator [Thalassovita aquimarina]
MSTATKAVIRTGRKFEQVLQGARQVFMTDGYEGASVDDIAKAAGVSKATLYSYFPDKRLLFMEVARSECDRQAYETAEPTDFNAPPRDILRLLGRKTLEIITSEFSQRIFRICVGESERFPELGREFYQTGPLEGRRRLSEYLRRSCARGELQIEDFDLAADQFIELCRVDIFPRVILGVDTEFSQAEIDRVVDGAVDMFMARYGT